MRLRRIIKWALFSILCLVLLGGVIYCWLAFPIISGYGAKNMASAIYLQHRKPAEILNEDLADFPISLGSYKWNPEDSSVTGSVWGFAKKKAIYRSGLGCTLINGLSEAEIRQQHVALPSPPNINLDTMPWPAGDKIPDSVPANINKVLLQQAIDHVMTEAMANKPALTRAVVVVYDGNIVGEQYAPGFGKNTVMLGWSVSKSLTSALIGILVKEGKLEPAAPAPVPEWKGTPKEQIKLKDLLQQASGLDFNEDYASPSDVTNMLFKQGDMAAYTAKHDLKYPPGTVFRYSSGNSNLLSRIIRQTVGEERYPSFPYEALFHRIHMYSALLEPDASGTYIGSSYSYATARDFARFGLLYYNKGRWNGEQILPESWVAETVQPTKADKQQRYGYQFWLNGFDEKDPGKRLFPDVPADMFYAVGYGGQYIFIIPSKKLVVVRTGLHEIDENKFLKELLQAIQQ